MKRTELVSTLELLKPALADIDLVPVLQCYHFTGKTILAYNDIVGIIAKCRTDDIFATGGNLLLGLLKNTTAAEVEFSLGNELSIKAGNDSFKLPYFHEKDFIFTEPEDNWATVIPINSNFIEGLTVCLTTSSRDLSHPAWMGVLLRHGKKHVIFYSSDGDAITVYTSKIASSNAKDKMLPNAFCDSLLRVMADTEAESGELFIGDTWAKAVTDKGHTIYGRLLMVDEPIDYETEIDNTLQTEPEYIPIPDGFAGALACSRIVADPETAPTVLTLDGQTLTLLTEARSGTVKNQLSITPTAKANAVVSAELIHRIVPYCTEMAVMENCTVFRKRESGIFQIIANLGE